MVIIYCGGEACQCLFWCWGWMSGSHHLLWRGGMPVFVLVLGDGCQAAIIYCGGEACQCLFWCWGMDVRQPSFIVAGRHASVCSGVGDGCQAAIIYCGGEACQCLFWCWGWMSGSHHLLWRGGMPVFVLVLGMDVRQPSFIVAGRHASVCSGVGDGCQAALYLFLRFHYI